MKIQIEINRETTESELLITSDFLRALRNDRSGKICEPVLAKDVTTATPPNFKIREEKTADVQEPENDQPGENKKLTEKEMLDMPVKELNELLKGYGFNAVDFDGKNTNAKVRGLLLKAQDGELELPSPDNEPDTDEFGLGEEEPEVKEVTIDMCRSASKKLIDKGKRDDLANAFSSCGCSSLTALRPDKYAMFYNIIKKL